MPGINLSQSVQRKEEEKKVKRSSWTGTVLMSAVLILSLVVCGGLYWYDSSLTSENEGTLRLIEEERANIPQDKVDQVADFQFRIENISDSFKLTTHPERTLSLLEANILPEVVLSTFTFDKTKGTVILAGEANEYRNVVQQMTALKKSPQVSSLSVDNLGRNENGKVSFSFSLVVAD
ncbi:MAG: hypothetical protein HGA31_02915 [Candidatus Moranbacteria bacterium]|nr:hypothetical protein [Candidatus Moranbacteria bacterium]